MITLYAYTPKRDFTSGPSGLSGLSGVIGEVALGPGNRVGFADTYGNFYYFTSPNLESMYGNKLGERLEVSEDYLSRSDPRQPVPGRLPWTAPGVGAPANSNHKWRNITLYAGLGIGALLLGGYLLNRKSAAAPAYQAPSFSYHPSYTGGGQYDIPV